jgi:hypothetical protein
MVRTATDNNRMGRRPIRVCQIPKRRIRARSCPVWIVCGRRRGMGGGSGRRREGSGSGVRSRSKIYGEDRCVFFLVRTFAFGVHIIYLSPPCCRRCRPKPLCLFTRSTRTLVAPSRFLIPRCDSLRTRYVPSTNTPNIRILAALVRIIL